MKPKTKRKIRSFSWIVMASFGIGGVVSAYQESLQMQKEQAAKPEAEKAVQTLREGVEHGEAVIDFKEQIKDWNPALEKLTGWTKADMLDKTLQDVMTPESWASHHMAYVLMVNSLMKGETRFLRWTIVDMRSIIDKQTQQPVEFRVRIVMVMPDGKPYANVSIDKATRIVSSEEVITDAATPKK